MFHVPMSAHFSLRMTVSTRATSTERRRAEMQTNAELQAQAADAVIAYKPPIITYGPWRPDGTRSSVGRYHNGSRFKSDGYPPRMLPRNPSGAL
jgi:hypothetical protein